MDWAGGLSFTMLRLCSPAASHGWDISASRILSLYVIPLRDLLPVSLGLFF